MGLFGNLKNLANPSQKPGDSPVSPAVKKVLIVEDDSALAQALAMKFSHEGFTVMRAENGKVGLDTALSQKPDIILLDLMMPIMDGKTMLHRLREVPEQKTTPVIVLTNAGDVDNMRETQVYDNAAAFLIKSNVKIEDIVAKAKELLS